MPGFHALTVAERRAALAQRFGSEAIAALWAEPALAIERADAMVENVVGVFGLPLGLCTNLVVDGVERLLPMVVEEPSVVAAASHGAKLLRAGGGVHCSLDAPEMVGQVQLVGVPDFDAAARRIAAAAPALLATANATDPLLVAHGGGARSIGVRALPAVELDDPCGDFTIVEIVVDVRDAMGANAVNTICERLAPDLEALSGGRAALRILSNLAARRLVRARGRVPCDALRGARWQGRALAERIVEASVFAERDPARAATHNKGLFNGIDAALLAFGQDWRAVEAGGHAWAARDGRYTALARWRLQGEALEGQLALPLPVGTVGGLAGSHPAVAAARRLARIDTAAELAACVAALGLAQNLAALRALSDDGIQRGHMRLHARKQARGGESAG